MSKDNDTPENAPKSNMARNAAIGAIGSAAVAAALLYAGRRFRKNPTEGESASAQSDKVPSGEPPETD